MRTLSELKPGEAAVIDRVSRKSSLQKRLLDLGMVHGTKVTCLQKSVSGDPKSYLIRDAVIAIRNSDAKAVYLIGV